MRTEYDGCAGDRYGGANDSPEVLRILNLIQGNCQELGIFDDGFKLE